jgi:hypothetical protein
MTELSLAEKVRRAKARLMRNRDIAAKYGITPQRVSRILWEARHKERRQAYETQWKREQYQTNEKYRAKRVKSAARYRARVKEERADV